MNVELDDVEYVGKWYWISALCEIALYFINRGMRPIYVHETDHYLRTLRA
ncbi:hypothetical protein Vsou_17770 [Vulcanisaeta souniana JCM 11219]|uniref:Uncharacterized protein n=1 Tax=Vulcanisaeta souniana JCM 11219 TaxID=1293586 RepID=A0A830EH65_9CREN|nr:hypothetical protein Vsou_17770 [Vulcanisaeta souniana JCM 11219]GGI84401.1 hypothetical protein GCM10007112_21710 [Vulcanisaeta souniana JCM 11219]